MRVQLQSAGYPVLIPSSQSDDCVFDSIFARQQNRYLVWVLGGGSIIIYIFGIETFLCVLIHIGGMASSCFGGINLVFVFLPYLIIFDKLPKILLGHFSLIHFQFLLSLLNNFSILLSVSLALLPDIFWLSVLVYQKWNCFLSLWLNAFWAVSSDENYWFNHLIILHFCRWYM